MHFNSLDLHHKESVEMFTSNYIPSSRTEGRSYQAHRLCSRSHRQRRSSSAPSTRSWLWSPGRLWPGAAVSGSSPQGTWRRGWTPAGRRPSWSPRHQNSPPGARAAPPPHTPPGRWRHSAGWPAAAQPRTSPRCDTARWPGAGWSRAAQRTPRTPGSPGSLHPQ